MNPDGAFLARLTATGVWHLVRDITIARDAGQLGRRWTSECGRAWRRSVPTTWSPTWWVDVPGGEPVCRRCLYLLDHRAAKMVERVDQLHDHDVAARTTGGPS